MKRHSPTARCARLAALAALALPLWAAAPARKAAPAKPAATTSASPGKPVPGKFTHPKLRGWVNDVPDTGQFLPDSVWLLQVGPRVTTVGDFVRGYFASYPEYRPGGDSLGRVQFLNSITNKDILGLTALALDQPLTFEDRLQIREARMRSLAQAVYQHFVQDSVSVSDEETRALWETYNWDLHARHILLADRNAADMVRRELISGRIPWSAAARKYSRPEASPSPDGDLGWLNRDKMERGIANVVFGLKPGEISKPVQDGRGWHLVQCVERKPRLPLIYEAIRRALAEDIRTAKSVEHTERVLALLRVQAGMRYDTATAEFASRHFGSTVKVQNPGVGTSIEIDPSVPEFSGADTARVIAQWNDGRFTIGSLLHAYSDVPPIMRPSLNVPEAVMGFVETLVLEPRIAEYGAQHGLEHDPDVEKALTMKKEQLLVERLYQDSVGARVSVSKPERLAYYEKNKLKFFTYPSVDFAAIARSSKAGADSVVRMLRSGVPATAIIAGDSARGLVSGSIQHRNNSEHGPYQKVLFEELRPGGIQVNGPDRLGDYAVIQLLRYDGGRQLPFAECEPTIDESLQNIKSDEALQALVSRLRKRYAVRSRPELLMLVRLVDPTLD